MCAVAGHHALAHTHTVCRNRCVRLRARSHTDVCAAAGCRALVHTHVCAQSWQCMCASAHTYVQQQCACSCTHMCMQMERRALARPHTHSRMCGDWVVRPVLCVAAGRCPLHTRAHAHVCSSRAHALVHTRVCSSRAPCPCTHACCVQTQVRALARPLSHCCVCSSRVSCPCTHSCVYIIRVVHSHASTHAHVCAADGRKLTHTLVCVQHQDASPCTHS
jgi:hypothetical protein